MSGCGTLFGTGAQYIKVVGGEFVAIDGSSTLERLLVSDLRMPYKQILKSRVVLKAGQQDYLLNHLGLGDNATFLAIKAIYDSGSVIEEDNYITWRFYNEPINIYPLAQMMVLTGNSLNRIKQLYLSNPNTKRPVQLEIIVAVIDDQTSFFNNVDVDGGTTLTNISLENIKTLKPNVSLQIVDANELPIIYFNLDDIISIERNGNIIQISCSVAGLILLIHYNEAEAAQTESALNYVWTIDQSQIIEDLVREYERPVIFFENIVTPLDTSLGNTFSSTITSTLPITKQYLLDNLVNYVYDIRDTDIALDTNNIIINKNIIVDGQPQTITPQTITATGSYIVKFNISDIALNNLDDVLINLTIN